MQLHDIKAPKGARKRRKIVGRGKGSGWGKTAGRGENGQRSRTGRWSAKGSEGGQMRLIRRLPKVGFRTHQRAAQVVNVSKLNAFDKDSVVNLESLKKMGLIKSVNKAFKILGVGEIKQALTVQTENISKTAQEKIEKAGGKVEIIIKDKKPVRRTATQTKK